MKPVAFDHVRAEDLDEVTEVLAQEGPDAVVLAGGMSLGPMLNMRLVRPRVVIDIGRVGVLQGILQASEGEIIVGAAVRQADAMYNDGLTKAVPLLAKALPYVGHYQTRSRGTLGGSVAHADPSAEVPLALLVTGGEVVLTSRRGVRKLGAEEFFKGMLVTARHEDEVLTGTRWRRCSPNARHAFAEFAQRSGDFAIAAAACALELDAEGRLHSLRVGLGGVEDRPVLVDTAQFLGEKAGDALWDAVSDHAGRSVDPLEDMTASAEYRKALATGLTRDVLTKAMAGGAE